MHFWSTFPDHKTQNYEQFFPERVVVKSPLKVLIVDDSPIVLKRLAALAEEQPYLQLVGMAGNGAEALDCFHQCRPDAVVLDLELPDRNGMEVLL